MKKLIHLTIVVSCLVILTILATSTMLRTSAASLDSKAEQQGPPWYDESWHYRRPVVISNGSNELIPFYQVLVRLDNSNFDFTKAKPDGSDLRLTDNSGRNPLNFWIESWDNQNHKAYIWVLVSSILPDPYSTTIYMYYDNPAASPYNGATPFDFFDTFSSFIIQGCTAGENIPDSQLTIPGWNIPPSMSNLDPALTLSNPWCVRSGTPVVSNSILSLQDGTGIKTINTQLYKAIGFRANYGLGAGKEWVGFVSSASGAETAIGDLPEHVDDLYLLDKVTALENVLLPRVGGVNWHGTYHNYEVRWAPGVSIGDIDHGAATALSTQPAQVPSSSLPIELFSYSGSQATLSIDWLYLREYRLPEPGVSLGMEQALVDLSIGQVDFPDPLFAGEALTYQLTITNTSSLYAPGVVVTDTLPGVVQLASINPSQGQCFPGSVILCNLNIIPPQSTVSITIIVTTTIDALITNQAEVGSPGYETDLYNNTSQANTTVMPSADLEADVTGYPDVLAGGPLTYVITVTNRGPSTASGVNIVDILPEEASYLGASLGTCDFSNQVVTCGLGNLTAAQQAHVVISTTVNSESTIVLLNELDTASDSTHDPDLNNNQAEASNLLDKDPPDVLWELPVGNEDIFILRWYGGTVTLEASATDNDRINRMRFLWYDHINHVWVSLGTVYSPPYTVQMDTSVLKAGELYQVFAQAYDRVGNTSMERIFIFRPNAQLMPFAGRN